jgi:hypothetical protein
MSESDSAGSASSDGEPGVEQSRGSRLAASAPTLSATSPPRAGARSWLRAAPVAWPTILTAALIIAIIGSGLFATHQVLTYGSLVPSIAGGWYGGYTPIQPGEGQSVSGYSLYILFADAQGDHLSATTSSCTTASNGLYTQAATPGIPYSGTINGSEFKMSAQPGDIESDLAWIGTYSTDKIHIDFFPYGTSTRIAYANLQRGTYSDFLATCKVK